MRKTEGEFGILSGEAVDKLYSVETTVDLEGMRSTCMCDRCGLSFSITSSWAEIVSGSRGVVTGEWTVAPYTAALMPRADCGRCGASLCIGYSVKELLAYVEEGIARGCIGRGDVNAMVTPGLKIDPCDEDGLGSALVSELAAAERAAGFDTVPPLARPAESPDFHPDNPVAHPLPMPRFPPINGWWFAVIVLLVLVISGLVLYTQTLREKISGYELTLSMTNAASFEHNAAIQRLECTGHEVQHCSGLVLSDAAQNLPARYICDSTHCAFECGNK